MSYTNASNLGVQHNEWLRKLEFYKEDLDILEKRLLEVSDKNTSTEARAGIEHFQNQFMIQRKNISELKHVIKRHTHQVFEDVKEHAGRVELIQIGDHQKIDEDVTLFEKTINELRQEFNLFLTKWM